MTGINARVFCMGWIIEHFLSLPRQFAKSQEIQMAFCLLQQL